MIAARTVQLHEYTAEELLRLHQLEQAEVELSQTVALEPTDIRQTRQQHIPHLRRKQRL